MSNAAAGGGGGGQRQTLNPVTRSIHELTADAGVHLLVELAADRIRKALSLKRFSQLNELPLPHTLLRYLDNLSLADFYINPDDVTGSHYHAGTFPATCLFDNSSVILRLSDAALPESDIVNDPAFLTRFECGNFLCSVYEIVPCLDDIIAEAAQGPTHLPEQTVWHHIEQLAEVLPTIPTSTKMSAKLFFLKSNHMFVRLPPAQAQDQTDIMPGEPNAIYEAPEVLMQQPADEYSSSWALGCLAYEIAALEPAYYDRENSGNIMMVMMGVVSGTAPPDLPNQYSSDLKNIIKQCLQKTPSDRPSLQEVLHMAQHKTQQVALP